MTPDHCEVTDGCITCGDVAVPLTVVDVHGSDARCRDDLGRTEDVAIELVDAVAVGDRPAGACRGRHRTTDHQER